MRRDSTRVDVQPPLVATCVAGGYHLDRPRTWVHGRPVSAPPRERVALGAGATRCVTPRQTCPRPDGFGRNLRSKTRWFTGFCNSHQVSHFATFFIDARAEISVAESRFGITTYVRSSPRAPRTGRGEGNDPLSFPWRIPRPSSLARATRRKRARRRGLGRQPGPSSRFC